LLAGTSHAVVAETSNALSVEWVEDLTNLYSRKLKPKAIKIKQKSKSKNKVL
jgi:hypothetical protein